MKTLTRATVLSAALSLSACTLLHGPPAEPLPSPLVPDAQSLLQQAQGERKGGNLAAAVETLSLAARHYPEDTRVRDELHRVSAEWLSLRHSVSDRLLIMQAENLEEEIPLLLKLRNIDPNDTANSYRLASAQQRLGQLARPLAECGQRNAEARPGLAERCLALSLIIEENPQVRALHRQVRAGLRPAEPRTAPPTAQATEPDTASEAQLELERVRELMASGENFHALQVLDELLLRDPGLVEAQELLFEVQAELDRYTELLLDTGNSLYREGRIEAAMSSWRAVLDLDPENQQARDNLSRAQRVVDNLERLRKEQKEAPIASPVKAESSPTPSDAILDIAR